jgi:hypothetical protein
VADLVQTGAFDEEWEAAVEADTESGAAAERWEVCQEIAYAVVEFPEEDWPDELRQTLGDTSIRVALCAGQQLLAADPAAHPRSVVRAIEEVEAEAKAEAEAPR